MAIDQPRINGNIYSWASIEAKVDGEIVHGFNSIAYAHKLETAFAYGQGRSGMPRGRTAGKYVPDPVKLKGPLDTMQALRASLAARATDGKSYGTVEFELTVQYVEPGETPVTVELLRCRLTGESTTQDEGPDAIMEEVEVSTFGILRNGLSLFDQTLGGVA